MVLQGSGLGARFGVSRRLGSGRAGNAAVIASTLNLRMGSHRKGSAVTALFCVTSRTWWALVALLVLVSLGGCTARQGKVRESRPLGPEPPAIGDGLLDLGNRELGERDTDAARARAREVLATYPDNADAYTILGAADWLDGRISSSNRALRAALEREPLHFGASLGLARNLRASGNVAESRRLMESLIADDPEQDLPWLGLLDTVWVAGDFGGVHTVGKAARSRDPVDALESEVVQWLVEIGAALEDSGPWCTVAGARGQAAVLWGNDLPLGVVAAEVEGTQTRVSTNWGSMLAEVTAEWLEEHELPTQGSVKWLGGAPASIVVIPRIAFGDLALERVPALVLPEGSAWRQHKVDIALGRHAVTAFGSIRMNEPEGRAEFGREPPVSVGNDAIVAPLFFLSSGTSPPAVRNTLATTLRLSPQGPEISVFLGAYPKALVVTDLLRTQLGVGDGNAELVDLPHVYVGDQDLGLTEAIVLESGTHEPTIDFVRELTSLELRGSFNPSALEGRTVTYAPASSQLIIEPTR